MFDLGDERAWGRLVVGTTLLPTAAHKIQGGPRDSILQSLGKRHLFNSYVIFPRSAIIEIRTFEGR